MFGELDGVGDEVKQDLAQPVGIAVEELRCFGRCLPAEVKLLGASLIGESLDDILHDAPQVEIHVVQNDLPSLDLGQVQDVIDERQKRAAAGLDDLGVSELLFAETGIEEQLQYADDAIHRRADFMAHVGQEAAFRQVGGIGGLAGLHQFVLVAPPLGDILGDTGDANQLAGLIVNRECAIADPSFASVRGLYPVSESTGSPAICLSKDA